MILEKWITVAIVYRTSGCCVRGSAGL